MRARRKKSLVYDDMRTIFHVLCFLPELVLVIKSTHYRDDGECNHLFTRAGEDAVKRCECYPHNFYPVQHPACDDNAEGSFGCFSAACDWMPFGLLCEVMFSRMLLLLLSSSFF